MQAPAFFVVEHRSIHCQITDATIGSSLRTVDGCRTLSHALASARRRAHIEYTNFGDGYFDVRARNEFGRLVPVRTAPVEADCDDMPF